VGEGVNLPMLMLPDPAHQVVRDAGIQNDPALIRHHIDNEAFHLFGRSFAALRMKDLRHDFKKGRLPNRPL
jgi:hypothetical protein